MRNTAFVAALGPLRGPDGFPPLTDGSVTPLPSPRHPYGVRVELRDDHGHGCSFEETWWVGLTDDGAVDASSAIFAAEEHHPNANYQDWRAA